MAVYGYARVSTARQANEGESLEVQQRQLEGYALMLGLKLESTFVEEGVSGSVPLKDRPAGSAMLAQLQSGDVVIAAKLDRCFRSAFDALNVLDDLKRKRVSLHLIDLGGDVTNNGISKLVFTILSAVAEAERDRTRERIGETKRDQKNRGRYLGGKVPFGYRVDGAGALVPHESEQQAIEHMRAMRADGKPLRAIAAAMQARGIKISHEGVSKVLATPPVEPVKAQRITKPVAEEPKAKTRTIRVRQTNTTRLIPAVAYIHTDDDKQT